MCKHSLFEERNEAPLITEILCNFRTIFTFAILTITVVVSQVIRFFPDVQNVSSLFASGGIGLSFGTIIQIAGFSFILAFFSVLLITERFIKKMRFFWRIFFLLIATLLTFSIFAVVFEWFVVDDFGAWVGLVLSTIFCFSISIGLTLLKFKLERKKYNRLLANYKAKQKENQSGID
jgi:hypothetical protein